MLVRIETPEYLTERNDSFLEATARLEEKKRVIDQEQAELTQLQEKEVKQTLAVIQNLASALYAGRRLMDGAMDSATEEYIHWLCDFILKADKLQVEQFVFPRLEEGDLNQPPVFDDEGVIPDSIIYTMLAELNPSFSTLDRWDDRTKELRSQKQKQAEVFSIARPPTEPLVNSVSLALPVLPDKTPSRIESLEIQEEIKCDIPSEVQDLKEKIVETAVAVEPPVEPMVEPAVAVEPPVEPMVEPVAAVEPPVEPMVEPAVAVEPPVEPMVEPVAAVEPFHGLVVGDEVVARKEASEYLRGKTGVVKKTGKTVAKGQVERQEYCWVLFDGNKRTTRILPQLLQKKELADPSDIVVTPSSEPPIEPEAEQSPEPAIESSPDPSTEEPKMDFSVGCRVTITGGNWNGHLATVTSKSGNSGYYICKLDKHSELEEIPGVFLSRSEEQVVIDEIEKNSLPTGPEEKREYRAFKVGDSVLCVGGEELDYIGKQGLVDGFFGNDPSAPSVKFENGSSNFFSEIDLSLVASAEVTEALLEDEPISREMWSEANRMLKMYATPEDFILSLFAKYQIQRGGQLKRREFPDFLGDISNYGEEKKRLLNIWFNDTASLAKENGYSIDNKSQFLSIIQKAGHTRVIDLLHIDPSQYEDLARDVISYVLEVELVKGKEKEGTDSEGVDGLYF